MRIGAPPENRRGRVVKTLWTCVWMVYLGAPVSDLVGGGHSGSARLLGILGLLAFVGCYLLLVFRVDDRGPARRTLVVLGVLAVEAAALTLSLGREWLVLFVYVSIASGASLPIRLSRFSVPAVTALLAGLGFLVPEGRDYLVGLLIPALLGGFAMVGVRAMIRTTVELRRARATVAQLAANEERLRLARDLHDLLGHSLSLITLKSELAGRMLPEHPEKAGAQIADIERVSRQALVDVREAVSGYRRPTLPGELAGARTALAAAGIVADLPDGTPPDAPTGHALPEEVEAALAWTLREAVTNVVRHSGARRCAITLGTADTLAGPWAELTVRDDGQGAPAGPRGRGNGLTGLAERLGAVSGTLATGPAGRTGFVLTARVPLTGTPAPAPTPDPGTSA
ncbi:sensor histidine kinase [Streptomyces sp. BI20]|uniref:sensor histidine kinase n=1 Tax=Streptomyces sp. BI20 TaxID=3403460 RepID=UPI003C73D409